MIKLLPIPPSLLALLSIDFLSFLALDRSCLLTTLDIYSSLGSLLRGFLLLVTATDGLFPYSLTPFFLSSLDSPPGPSWIHMSVDS